MKYNILSFIAGILLLTIIIFVRNDDSGNNSIKMLKIQNDSLILENKKLDSISNSYLVEMNKLNFEMLQIEKEDSILNSKVYKMNQKLIIINNKYEKARNYSNNFGSNELKRYFSELK